MSGSRRDARKLAVKGLYHWIINETDPQMIVDTLASEPEYKRADTFYLKNLLLVASKNAQSYLNTLLPLLDRPIAQLSPIEQSIFLIAMVELRDESDVPFKVVINECVELTKLYGGSDGYKYVNGVLDRYLKGLREKV